MPPDQAISWLQRGGDVVAIAARRPASVSLGLLLTPREHVVARLAASGLTNREIATQLAIAEKTAANHLQRVLEKLDLRSRTQLAARAAELGMTPVDAPPILD